MSSSSFTCLNFDKYIRVHIFMTIKYLKHFYLIPLNLHVSSVVRSHGFMKMIECKPVSSVKQPSGAYIMNCAIIKYLLCDRHNTIL